MTYVTVAKHIGVSRVALSRVLNEKAGVTSEMSMKISEAFGQSQGDIWFRVENAHASQSPANAIMVPLIRSNPKGCLVFGSIRFHS